MTKRNNVIGCKNFKNKAISLNLIDKIELLRVEKQKSTKKKVSFVEMTKYVEVRLK